MARAFEAEFEGHTDAAIGVQSGFFHAVDGAPATGYRAPRIEFDAGALPEDPDAFGGSGLEAVPSAGVASVPVTECRSVHAETPTPQFSRPPTDHE